MDPPILPTQPSGNRAVATKSSSKPPSMGAVTSPGSGTRAKLVLRLLAVLIGACLYPAYIAGTLQASLRQGIGMLDGSGSSGSNPMGTTITKPTIRTPRRPLSVVYWCGYGNLFDESRNGGLASHLFPESTVVHLKETDRFNATQDDVLLYPGGPKPKQPFPGKIVVFNGESHKWWLHTIQGADEMRRTYVVAAVDLLDAQAQRPGVNPTSAATVVAKQSLASYRNHTHNATADVAITFMSMHFMSLGREWQDRVLQPQAHPRGTYATKPHFLLYVQGNCVQHRERAFGALSKLFSDDASSTPNRPVHYGGKCRGQGYTDRSNVQRVTPQNATAVQGWPHNSQWFADYRFALVMENRQQDGYVTEKIINAFCGGAIPIYFGAKDVLEIFHPDAFVYYDVSNPQPALDRIRYLETNRTAYDAVLRGPILRNGHETIRKYFSWNDDLGHGAIKWFVRDMIGYG